MRVHSGKNKIIAEINMIPLIDISLILLIIFMVITPFLVQSQNQVNLPKASAGTRGGDEEVLKVQLAADGTMTVDGKRVKYNRLKDDCCCALILQRPSWWKPTRPCRWNAWSRLT